MKYIAKEFLSYIYAGLVLTGYNKEEKELEWLGTPKQWRDQEILSGNPHDCHLTPYGEDGCKHPSHYEL